MKYVLLNVNATWFFAHVISTFSSSPSGRSFITSVIIAAGTIILASPFVFSSNSISFTASLCVFVAAIINFLSFISNKIPVNKGFCLSFAAAYCTRFVISTKSLHLSVAFEVFCIFSISGKSSCNLVGNFAIYCPALKVTSVSFFLISIVISSEGIILIVDNN